MPHRLGIVFGKKSNINADSQWIIKLLMNKSYKIKHKITNN